MPSKISPDAFWGGTIFPNVGPFLRSVSEDVWERTWFKLRGDITNNILSTRQEIVTELGSR